MAEACRDDASCVEHVSGQVPEELGIARPAYCGAEAVVYVAIGAKLGDGHCSAARQEANQATELEPALLHITHCTCHMMAHTASAGHSICDGL